ncbi:MAG: D-alanine--D-alanine ligase, partial [Candidatus Omnitrophota bacterium]
MKKFTPGRIGVLMGGVSTEREISLKSGKAVYAALKSCGEDAEAIDIVEGTEEEVVRRLKESRVKVAFLALHGRFGEDGTIQSFLEKMQMPFTGSSQKASRLAMDKIASRRRFIEKGIAVPRHYNLNRADPYELKKIIRLFDGFPLVIKPSSHGSSIGITLAEDEVGVEKAIAVAFSYDENIIIEEFIAGRELTVGILEERPLPVVEIVPKEKFFDFSAKY